MTSITLSGVLVSVFDIGIWLTGESGAGKSDTALQLLDRQHQLVADDAVKFSRKGDHLVGQCPSCLRDLLEVRNLGIINVKQLFGANAVQNEVIVNMKCHLSPDCTQDRLNPPTKTYQILDINLPEIHINTQLNRNLALLIETLAKRSINQDRSCPLTNLPGSSVLMQFHEKNERSDGIHQAHKQDETCFSRENTREWRSLSRRQVITRDLK